MDQLIEEYMKKKYGDDYQAKAEAELADRKERINMGSIASGFGAALAGRDPNSANDYYSGLQKQAKADTLDKLKDEKNSYSSDIKTNSELSALMSKDELIKAQQDPKSRQSILANAMARKYSLPVREGDSYKDISQFMNPQDMFKTEAAANVEFNKQKALKSMEFGNQKDRDDAKFQHDQDMEEIKRKKEKSAPERLKAMSGTDKARFDNALMTLKAIDEMGSALDNGQHTKSLIGDNDYTAASRRAIEAYGRMQSGGAINKDEEARFEKTLPGILDDKKMQRSKLLKQREEMISRLKTLGFTPDEVGYSPKDFNYGSSKQEGGKKVVDRQINKKTGQTRLVYSDGSFEVVDSKIAGGR